MVNISTIQQIPDFFDCDEKNTDKYLLSKHCKDKNLIIEMSYRNSYELMMNLFNSYYMTLSELAQILVNDVHDNGEKVFRLL